MTYIFEILQRPDSFTNSFDDETDGNVMQESKNGANSEKNTGTKVKLGSMKIDKLKIQLLKLVFYVFFESEKISEDVTKNTQLILEFFTKEANRLDKFEADQCSPLY